MTCDSGPPRTKSVGSYLFRPHRVRRSYQPITPRWLPSDQSLQPKLMPYRAGALAAGVSSTNTDMSVGAITKAAAPMRPSTIPRPLSL
jgi:hypothetical protein